MLHSLQSLVHHLVSLCVFTGMAASFACSTPSSDLGKAKRRGGAGCAAGVSVSALLRNVSGSPTGSASQSSLSGGGLSLNPGGAKWKLSSEDVPSISSWCLEDS